MNNARALIAFPFFVVGIFFMYLARVISPQVARRFIKEVYLKIKEIEKK